MRQGLLHFFILGSLVRLCADDIVLLSLPASAMRKISSKCNECANSYSVLLDARNPNALSL